MSFTANNAAAALARARRSTRWAAAMCLRFVADAFSDGALGYNVADAAGGWARTTQRHYDRTPPAGVPVYWTSPSPHGHVAISTGGGWVRSTDWPSRGLVGEVAISQLERAWNLRYLGWGADFCGDTIAGLTPPVPVLRSGSTGALVRHLQAELLRVFPAYAAPIRSNGGPNGIYGPATVAVVREFQHRCAMTVDGVVGANTWAHLAKFGIRPA